MVNRVIIQFPFRGGEANFNLFVFSYFFLETFDEIFDQLSGERGESIQYNTHSNPLTTLSSEHILLRKLFSYLCASYHCIASSICQIYKIIIFTFFLIPTRSCRILCQICLHVPNIYFVHFVLDKIRLNLSSVYL